MAGDVVVYEQLELLRNEVEYLKDERDHIGSLDEYLGDARLRRAVERGLQVAIEICLDIGRRLIAVEGLRYPEDNQDVFRVLVDEGVLPKELWPQLRSMVRFRNLLVHNYARIDDGQVYAVLTQRLGDLDVFARVVIEHLESE